MKKIKILSIVVLAVALFCSCEDNSGTYVEQLFTNQQKETAFTTCLTSSVDSAISHLCSSNGFYNYNNGAYRIDFSSLQHSVFDTLMNHQLGYLSDSLILCTNRLAESCNAQVTSAFKSAINSMTYTDHDALLNGGDHAITDYFELYKRRALEDSLKSPVAIRLNVYNVNNTWASVMNAYRNYSSTPVNVDLQGYIIDKMLDGIFEEMRIEEYNIRTDSTHRVSGDSLLGL